jgi:hypothetical protein
MMARASASTRPAVLEEEEVEPAAEAPVGKGGRSESQLKAHLRNKAERFILDKYKTEYHDKLGELYAERKLEYKRVLSPEEKEEKELMELLERRPDLKAKIVQENAPEHVPDDTPGGEG